MWVWKETATQQSHRKMSWIACSCSPAVWLLFSCSSWHFSYPSFTPTSFSQYFHTLAGFSPFQLTLQLLFLQCHHSHRSADPSHSHGQATTQLFSVHNFSPSLMQLRLKLLYKNQQLLSHHFDVAPAASCEKKVDSVKRHWRLRSGFVVKKRGG